MDFHLEVCCSMGWCYCNMPSSEDDFSVEDILQEDESSEPDDITEMEEEDD